MQMTSVGTGLGLGLDVRLYQDFEDAQVRVVSDQPVSKAAAEALAARVERAWVSNQKAHQWDDVAPLKEQLTVVLLSQENFSEFTGDSSGAVAGVTTGKDVFVMPSRVTAGMSKLDEATIAHELAHVQDFRQADAAMDSIPTWLEEGKAYVLGDAYGKEPRHLAQVAQTMGAFRAKDAEYLLANFKDASAEQREPAFVYAGEVMGALFVEYLSAHVRPDAIARISDAIEAAGDGQRFPAAFQKAVGVSLGRAQRDFVRFVRETEGDPRSRLEGTLYALH
jgi:Domain of unknown function (DUF4157)